MKHGSELPQTKCACCGKVFAMVHLCRAGKKYPECTCMHHPKGAPRPKTLPKFTPAQPYVRHDPVPTAGDTLGWGEPNHEDD